MVAITDETSLINALKKATGPRTFTKQSSTAEGAGTWFSQWKVLGHPVAGANPPLFSAGAGYVPTKATAGAFPFTNAAVNGDCALLAFSANGATPGTVTLYDRLWACSGFGTVVTTSQNVVTPGSLPAARDPNGGLDVELWGEVYTAPGATAATWTVVGVDSGANAGRTYTYAHPANAESIGQMFPIMPGGATPTTVGGIGQVTSFTASATSGTAGDIGLTLLRRIKSVPIVAANIGGTLDALLTGLPRVYNDSCLALMVQCTTTNTGLMIGDIAVGDA